MPFIACKLPSGLVIDHEGKSLTLVGGNIGEDLGNVSRNGSPNDNSRRESGFGLTEISAEQATWFEAWAKAVTTDKDGAKLTHPFLPLENGTIAGPFKNIDEARKECRLLSGSVPTGFEGLDEEEEAKKTGITKADKPK